MSEPKKFGRVSVSGNGVGGKLLAVTHTMHPNLILTETEARALRADLDRAIEDTWPKATPSRRRAISRAGTPHNRRKATT